MSFLTNLYIPPCVGYDVLISTLVREPETDLHKIQFEWYSYARASIYAFSIAVCACVVYEMYVWLGGLKYNNNIKR